MLPAFAPEGELLCPAAGEGAPEGGEGERLDGGPEKPPEAGALPPDPPPIGATGIEAGGSGSIGPREMGTLPELEGEEGPPEIIGVPPAETPPLAPPAATLLPAARVGATGVAGRGRTGRVPGEGELAVCVREEA
ncbi:MAG: hypothetical protein AAF491_06290 [Verrucomicrobiota bacterium]